MENTGWELSETQKVAIMNDREIASPSIIALVKCGCKQGCNTLHCSCLKNGMTCSTLCKCDADCCNEEEFSETSSGSDSEYEI